MPEPSVGSRVIVRGRYASRFSLHGKVEVVETTRMQWMDQDPPLYGVRLVNGNFHWVSPERLKLDQSIGG